MSGDEKGEGTPIRRIKTRGGAELSALGLGTYRMGEDRARRAKEVAALKLGLDLGMTLIDTAEMYADGGAEKVTGEAVKGRRDEVFIVTKVLPRNASRRGTIEAAERSLRRLGTDRIDLYLLHWQGSHPLQETFDAFAQLVHEQKIVHYGVSNLDARAMEKAESLGGGSDVIATRQSRWSSDNSSSTLQAMPETGPKSADMPSAPLHRLSVLREKSQDIPFQQWPDRVVLSYEVVDAVEGYEA